MTGKTGKPKRLLNVVLVLSLVFGVFALGRSQRRAQASDQGRVAGAARVQSAVGGFNPRAEGEFLALAEVPVRVGPEILVNATNTFDDQWHPSVAPLPNGGSVVVWADVFLNDRLTGLVSEGGG